MIAFGYYLLKVVICSGLLFLYYHVALRNKLFHQWNRFYLLAAIILSLIVPYLEFNVLSTTGESRLEAIKLENIKILNVIQAADQYVAAANSGGVNLSTAQWSMIAYAAISAIMLALLLLALFRIRSIIRSNSVVLIDDIKFVTTEEKNSPFTFFNYVFWNKNIELNTSTGEHIFQHELVHVRDHHSIDKIFVQAVLIVFWCNPFFWLIKKELRMIHEFIADKKSVGQSDAHLFAKMILQTVYPNHFIFLANHFFQSPIKRRLSMLMKKHNPKISYFSRLLALPVVAFVVLAFTVKAKPASGGLQLAKEITVVIDAGHGGGTGARADGYVEDELALQIAKKIKTTNSNDKIKILLTRENEQNIAVKERVEFARNNNADLFISIHVNARYHGSDVRSFSPKARTEGLEVYVSSKNPSYQSQSKLIGSAVIKELSNLYSTNKALLTRATRIWVIDHNVCPSLLIECGYLTNKEDRTFISKKENQELIAQKILNAIELYATNNSTSNVPNEKQPARFLPEVSVVDLSSKNPGTLQLKINATDTTPIKKRLSSAQDPNNKIYEKVEVEAEFPGGLRTWRRYLERNLNAQIPSTKKSPVGSYTVIAKYIVDRAGNVSNVKTLTNHGYGMEEEVIRVIKEGPKWTPAIQNGRNVVAYRQQPITFVVANK